MEKKLSVMKACINVHDHVLLDVYFKFFEALLVSLITGPFIKVIENATQIFFYIYKASSFLHVY